MPGCSQPIKIVLSLVTKENDYQMAQAAAAEQTARRLDASLQILFAGNDPVNQSQQVLQAIQAGDSKPNGIVVFPISDTGLVQVGKLAVSSGIGWAVVSRNVDYLSAIRGASVPAFKVIADHVEIGRIQGRQVGVVAPEGGVVLYIQGPASAPSAIDRAAGFGQTVPANIEVRALRASWTHKSAHDAICGWLRLATSASLPVRAIVAQNDAMAMGARSAIEEQMTGSERERWLRLPFFGCDGIPEFGQKWVTTQLLKATVIHPLTAGLAVEMLVNALRSGKQPQETTVLSPSSYPPIQSLKK